MTLWLLLTAISGSVPLVIATIEGYKAGFLGVVLGIVVGVIMALATIVTVTKIDNVAFSRMKPYDENNISIRDEFLCGLLYLANIGCGIGSAFIAQIIVETINKVIF